MRILLVRAALIAVTLGWGGTRMACAIEVKVSAQALERTSGDLGCVAIARTIKITFHFTQTTSIGKLFPD